MFNLPQSGIPMDVEAAPYGGPGPDSPPPSWRHAGGVPGSVLGPRWTWGPSLRITPAAGSPPWTACTRVLNLLGIHSAHRWFQAYGKRRGCRLPVGGRGQGQDRRLAQRAG